MAGRVKRGLAERQATAETAADPVAAAIPEGPGDVREPGTRIGFLVHDVSRMRRTLYDQEVKPLGLTRSQWWVLSQLTRRMVFDGVLQTELANHLDVSKVTIGGIVDRLEARGFVERRPDLVDRRVKRVFVTESGRAVLKDMIRVSTALNASIFRGFTDEEVRVAEAFLDRMKANIKGDLQARDATPVRRR